MKISITIQCEDSHEILIHLKSIKNQVKKCCDLIDNSNESIFRIEDDNLKFEDNNAYGFHEIIIDPENENQATKKTKEAIY